MKTQAEINEYEEHKEKVRPWHDFSMLGVPVRIHDMTGDELGIAHVPSPVCIGDLVALEHSLYRVYEVVETGQTLPDAAIVKVRPAHLQLAVR